MPKPTSITYKLNWKNFTIYFFLSDADLSSSSLDLSPSVLSPSAGFFSSPPSEVASASPSVSPSSASAGFSGSLTIVGAATANKVYLE